MILKGKIWMLKVHEKGGDPSESASRWKSSSTMRHSVTLLKSSAPSIHNTFLTFRQAIPESQMEAEVFLAYRAARMRREMVPALPFLGKFLAYSKPPLLHRPLKLPEDVLSFKFDIYRVSPFHVEFDNFIASDFLRLTKFIHCPSRDSRLRVSRPAETSASTPSRRAITRSRRKISRTGGIVSDDYLRDEVSLICFY
jgi:hypothetical protein